MQWADAHQLGRYADVGSQSQMVHNSHLSWANLGWQKILASTLNLPPILGLIEPSALRIQPPFHLPWFSHSFG